MSDSRLLSVAQERCLSYHRVVEDGRGRRGDAMAREMAVAMRRGCREKSARLAVEDRSRFGRNLVRNRGWRRLLLWELSASAT